MNSLRKTIAASLKHYRQLRDLTQDDLAKLTWIGKTHISHFECGRRLPSLENLLKLTDALDVSIDSIFGRADNGRFKSPMKKHIDEYFSELRHRDQQAVVDLAKLLRAR